MTAFCPSMHRISLGNFTAQASKFLHDIKAVNNMVSMICTSLVSRPS